jgi:prophage regulatory protein
MKRYVSDVQLAERYSVSRSSIWRWSAKGILPRPVQLSPGCTRWAEEEIERRDAARDRQRNFA